MKRTVPLISFFFMSLLLLAGIPLDGARQPAPLLTGIFSKEQVQRGKKLYESRCALCHGAELKAEDPEAGDLTGITFRINWQGKTIGDRFDVSRTTMPPGSASILTDQEHLDILTFILNFNGYPVGDKELTLDLERFKQIVIVPLY